MSSEWPKSEESPSVRIARTINERLHEGKFHFGPGENHEDIAKRAELLRATAEDLPWFAKELVHEYREILSAAGITREQTGELSCLLVGGNVHKESSLKSWSDFDLVIAAEHPFSPLRTNKKEGPPPISYPLRHKTGNDLWKRFIDVLAPKLNESLSIRLNRPVDIRDLESPDGGLIEIKGFGDQRPEEVQDSLLLATEE